jgi:mannose-6-phosphate isomerase-like protein (cupin superfamily)
MSPRRPGHRKPPSSQTESDSSMLLMRPWGYEYTWAMTEKYAGRILYLRRAEKLPLHYHEATDGTFLLIKGSLDLELGDDESTLAVHRLAEGDSRRIRPLQRHRLTALEDCYLFEVSTSETDDVVRLEHRYERAIPEPVVVQMRVRPPLSSAP